MLASLDGFFRVVGIVEHTGPRRKPLKLSCLTCFWCFRAKFSADGFLQEVETIDDKVKTKVEMEIISYGTAHRGDKSGAYLFMPDGPAKVWPLTQFFSVSFCENSLICLGGKSVTPHRGNTILFRSSQQLPRLRLGPSKGFLS